jgi:Tfp pilus assembly protein PilF
MDFLVEMGIPLSGQVTDPRTALVMGAAKASLYNAHQKLEDGRAAEAAKACDAALSMMKGDNSPKAPLVRAAIMVVRGRAQEAQSDPDGAAACYRSALDSQPGYAPATAALSRVTGGAE